jgi:membrane-associated protein
MELLAAAIDIFLHLDKHLALLLTDYGTLTYLLLFLVIFCETGLVVTPFLPGDSLLFAAGALAATTGALDVNVLAITLLVAAILGDATNYYIGRRVGLKLFEEVPNPGFFRRNFLKREYLTRTEGFYAKYGGKAVVLARFAPILRTFAPFLAGVGTMNYSRFAFYNVTGAILWVGLFVYGGYLFSDNSLVRNNFTLVILAIIAISLMPIVIEFLRARAEHKRAQQAVQ